MEGLEVDETVVGIVQRFIAQSKGSTCGGSTDGGEAGLLSWSPLEDGDGHHEPIYALEKELGRLDGAYTKALLELKMALVDMFSDDQDGMVDIELQELGHNASADISSRLLDVYRKAVGLRKECAEAVKALTSLLEGLKAAMQADAFAEVQVMFDGQGFVGMADLDSLLKEVSLKYKEATGTVLSLQEAKETAPWTWKVRWLLLAVTVTCIVLLLPAVGAAKNTPVVRCIALVAGVLVLWVTEALPFYVTAMAIPVLTVLFRIYELPAHAAAQLIFSQMFNHTTALVLGGFSLSSAFSKYGFEKRLIHVLQAWLGDRPSQFLLSLMAVSWFFSMWISNVAASVLSLSVVMPILHSLPTNSAYAKATLLGLALSCNIGGMLSPISSPQNAIALGTLAGEGLAVTFMKWLAVSIPFCLVLLIGLWLYLMIWLRPTDVTAVPTLCYTSKPLGTFEWIVVVTSLVTAMLWCTLGLTESILGDMGIVGFVPLLVFLSTGVLTKDDFLAFGWNLIMLIAGGNVLGAAVAESKLLDIVADAVMPHLQNLSPWAAFAAVTSLCLVTTTPLSHTVGAIVLVPMVLTIGKQLGNAQVLVVGAAFTFSGAMALPTSSFPNINSLLAEDPWGRPYLHAMDFIKYAGLFSLVVLCVCLILGYPLLTLVLQ